MENTEFYSSKDWLNPIDDYATSYISCFSGETEKGKPDTKTSFITLANCFKAIRIYKGEDSKEKYISKLETIRESLKEYINYLNNE